jgi:hypothetical protein
MSVGNISGDTGLLDTWAETICAVSPRTFGAADASAIGLPFGEIGAEDIESYRIEPAQAATAESIGSASKDDRG